MTFTGFYCFPHLILNTILPTAINSEYNLKTLILVEHFFFLLHKDMRNIEKVIVMYGQIPFIQLVYMWDLNILCCLHHTYGDILVLVIGLIMVPG